MNHIQNISLIAIDIYIYFFCVCTLIKKKSLNITKVLLIDSIKLYTEINILNIILLRQKNDRQEKIGY
jgi:hypothetical protein